jgi:glycosyltransferase involved in cell wall biosynthesis
MRLPQATEAAAQLGLPVVAHVSDFVYPCARVTLLRADGSPCPDAEEGRACRSACAIPTGPDRFAWGRDTLAAAAVVVSPCRATIATHAAFGFDTAGWRHIPWGVDYALHPERLPAPAGGPLRIGFLGTLLRHKGPHVLVEAVRLLAGRDVELVLYGGSFHEPGYERELRRLAGGDPRIRFAGAYDHATLPQVLAPLDLVAIPSLWPENLPTVGLNAVAAGVPLLVSDVPGLTELLDDYRCGHAFAAGDPASAATVLASLLDDRDGLADLRRTMAFPPGLEEEAWALEALYAELRS